MVWACLPRPDGDPVFSALLQKEGGESRTGVFAIDLVDLTRTEQEYQRNSAIIETRLYDSHGGVLRIVDFAPRFRSRGRVFRPMMFVRSVEPLAGRPTLRLRLRPTAGFGERSEPGISGSHHIRFQPTVCTTGPTARHGVAAEDRLLGAAVPSSWSYEPCGIPRRATRDFGRPLKYGRSGFEPFRPAECRRRCSAGHTLTLAPIVHRRGARALTRIERQYPRNGTTVLLAARLYFVIHAEPSGAPRPWPIYTPRPDHRHDQCGYLATAVRHHRGSARRGEDRYQPVGIPRHGAGAFRQRRRRAGATRCLRLGDPGRDAIVLRRAPGAFR